MGKLTIYDQYLDVRWGTQRSRQAWKKRARFTKKLWKKFFAEDFRKTKSKRRQALKDVGINSTDEEVEEILVNADWVKPKGVYLD